MIIIKLYIRYICVVYCNIVISLNHSSLFTRVETPTTNCRYIVVKSVTSYKLQLKRVNNDVENKINEE